MPRLHLLQSHPAFDICGPNSAVANFLREIATTATALQYEVFVNGIRYLHANPEPRDAATPLPAVRSRFAWLPRRNAIYNSARDYRWLSAIKAVEQHRLSALQPGDLAIEFPTYASRLGVLAKAKGARVGLIYDAPLTLQYRENYGSGSFFLPLMARREREMVAAADAVWCYGSSVASHIKQHFHIRTPIFEFPCLLYQPVAEAVHRPIRDFAFIGSFLSWHRTDILLQAFYKALPQLPRDAHLHFAGKGPMWEDSVQLAASLGIAERVTFYGYLSDAALNDLKSRAHAGVMPGSNWYGSPLKLFEYAFAGWPFIAPDTPTVRDLFGGIPGMPFIDSESQVTSLAHHLIRMANDDDFAFQLALKQQQYVDTHYGKSLFSHTLNTFLKTLSTSGGK
jgi:glycosyltransferase involved in cell wall biosynthesis